MAIDGRIVLGVLATPFIYSTLKSAYWSGQMKKLNDREVLAERYVELLKSTHTAQIFLALQVYVG